MDTTTTETTTTTAPSVVLKSDAKRREDTILLLEQRTVPMAVAEPAKASWTSTNAEKITERRNMGTNFYLHGEGTWDCITGDFS